MTTGRQAPRGHDGTAHWESDPRDSIRVPLMHRMAAVFFAVLGAVGIVTVVLST